MSFCTVRLQDGLWCASAFYSKRSGATSVTHSWHRTRAEAVETLTWHF